MNQETIFNKICNQHVNLIIKEAQNSHNNDLMKKDNFKKLLAQATSNNDAKGIMYYQREINILEEKIKAFETINDKTKELLSQIIQKTSKYLYVNLNDHIKELVQEAHHAYQCGDNETLQEIYDEVKTLNLEYAKYNEDYYNMLLMMLNDAINHIE